VAVLPGGERLAAQGGVHRDVTGYDLVGALLGSMGRLAVITAAYFRLAPAGVELSAPEPPGAMPALPHDELLRAAFDPGALLRPARAGQRAGHS
jgi:hypothetical protein